MLDLLRDIGGLFNAFNAIFSGIVIFLNYNGLYHWLTSKLFRAESMSDYMEQQIVRNTS